MKAIDNDTLSWKRNVPWAAIERRTMQHAPRLTRLGGGGKASNKHQQELLPELQEDLEKNMCCRAEIEPTTQNVFSWANSHGNI